MMRILPAFLLTSFWLVAAASMQAAEPAPGSQPDAEGIAYFEKHIRPLLIQHCYKCHSKESKILKGGLLLDSREGWQRGGDLGDSIVPGKPEESLLIQAVKYDEDAGLEMPPKKKLSPQQIASLVHWVKIGAPDPRVGGKPLDAGGLSVEEGRKFWAFQPPIDPEVPEVADKGWPRSPLDQFILSGLEAKGIKPAPAADRRTLIRRVTFDLIGLPPTRSEIASFLADKSPDAYATVVERLLASPQYGERWARHWLDVARYSDSNGLDENIAHGNAWRYRDYVVAAFNTDKPYDQFIVEQLAGDLLSEKATPQQRNERLIATAFLSLGPKVLAEVDETKMEMDIIDEQIETTGRAFLGMTLGCARCHDHKFDPIRQKDYYGLAGIFKSTKTMESFKKIARWHENPLHDPVSEARKAKHEKLVADEKAKIAAVVKAANEKLKADGGAEFKLPAKPEASYPEATKAELKKLRESVKELEKTAPELATAMGVTAGEPTNVKVHIRGSHLSLGEEVLRRFPEVMSLEQASPIPEQQSGRLELAHWLTGDDHPLTSRVMVNRIWRWHFGQGLVATTDNFGHSGSAPSNPSLLDWLARRFIKEGWSIKQMHRLILLSSTYQMSSRYDASAAKVDSTNKLHWRTSVRRLEGDVLRDALLAVSGKLDMSMGGKTLKLKNREFVFNHESKDATTYDSMRRSLYLPVIRNNLYDVFQLFDFPDPAIPNGNRPTTTIAPQALFVLNSELVAEVTQKLAADLFSQSAADDTGRVRQLYETAYGRLPSPEESARARVFIAQYEVSLEGDEQDSQARTTQAWQALCHVILASNEFVYLR